MQKILRNCHVALVSILAFSLPGIALAGATLDDWRGEIVTVRTLAENNAPQAYTEAQRLQEANIPVNALPAETDSKQRQIDELNLRNRLQATQQDFLLALLGSCVLMLAATTYLVLRLRRSREEIRALNSGLEQQMQGLQKQRETEFHRLADNAPDPIFRYDRDCRRIYVNPAVEKLSGMSASKLLGKTTTEAPFIPDEESIKVQQSVARVLKTGLPSEIDMRCVAEDGRERYFHNIHIPEFGLKGEVTSVLSIVHDVSERKAAENALCASEERMRLFFERQLVGMAITSAEKGWLHVNDKLCEMLGYSFDELKNRTWAEMTHPEDLAADEAQFDRILHGEIDSYTLEKRYVRKDGSIVITNLAVGCVRREDRSVDYVLAMLDDISERKRMELELREQKDFQQLLLNALKEVGIQMMIVENGRIDYILDRKTLNDCGYADEEIDAGVALLDIIHPDDREMVLDMHLRRLAGESVPSCYEQGIISRYGERREFESSVAIVPGTNPVRVITVGKDITERKRMERELLRREQYQRTLLDNFPFFVWLKDESSRLLAANSQYARVAGVGNTHELEGKTDFDFFPDDLAGKYVADDQAVMAQGTSKTVEEMYCDENGARHWMETWKSPVVVNGKTVGTVGWSRDITEQKRYEAEREATKKRLQEQNVQLQAYKEELELRVEVRTAELSASNQLLRAEIDMRKQTELRLHQEIEFSEGVINAIPDLLFKVNSEGVYLNVWTQNPELLAAQKETLLGNNIRNVLAPDAAEISMSAIREAAESGYSFGKIIRIELPQGEHWFELSVAKQTSTDNSNHHFIILSRDITERKRAEEIIFLREREFRTLAENMPDNIVRYDRDAIAVYVNPVIEKTFGDEVINMIGTRVREYHPDGSYEVYAQAIDNVLATGEGCEIEMFSPDPRVESGDIHQIRFVAERDETGEVVGVLAIGRDITKLKRAERDLNQSRAQLRGLVARREGAREDERKHIAREIHDELGQILTGLKLNIDLLIHKYAANSATLHKDLEQTKLLTKEAVGVARNISTALRPVELDMGIVPALTWQADRFSTFTGIQCCMHADENEIRLDEKYAVALFRIVQESLTNVAKHAQADRVDITLSKDADDYILKIRDNGTGFDTSERKFNSFGLVGIQERAVMLGGAVSINSHPGNGTEILVRISTRSILEKS